MNYVEPVWDIRKVESAHRRKGGFFFEPSSKRFFRSRIGADTFEGPGGVYFTTSEQFVSSRGDRGPRRYTVRYFRPDSADVGTFGEFQGYASSVAARHAAARAAAGTVAP